jgi:hypothetical protein
LSLAKVNPEGITVLLEEMQQVIAVHQEDVLILGEFIRIGTKLAS